MFKTYERYIVKNFFNKFITVSLVFFSLIIILRILEEISFFTNTEVNFLLHYIITLF